LLAVEKPAGIDVGGEAGGTLGVIELLHEVRGETVDWQPCNRLSRYESGVLALGKQPSMVEFLRTGLREQSVEQEYVAVVHGKMADHTMLIGTDRGASQGKGRQRWKRGKRTAGSGDSSHLTRLERLYEGPRRTILRCVCRARTTHVLRAQLRFVGLRLLGDRLHDRSPRPDPHHLTCLHLARLSFHHPALRRRTAIHSDPPPVFQSYADGELDPQRGLHTALLRRLPLLVQNDTDAFRLLTGAREDVPGLAVERFGPVVLLFVYQESPRLETTLHGVAEWYRHWLDASAVYVKRFVKDRAAADDNVLDELHTERPLLGKPAPEEIVIRENGLRFLIRPHGGFSTGLFLDHRDNRKWVRSLAEGRDVLNLFAYTCGFSVAAAAGGAASTTSVDLSSRALEWGRRNFALNHLESTNHQFVAEGAAEFLRRATRREQRFDLLLIDPPTFAHGKGKHRDFSITQDLGELISLAASVLRPNGILMVSTNCRTLTQSAIREEIKRAVGFRRLTILKSPPLPIDYAVDPDHAKTILARLH